MPILFLESKTLRYSVDASRRSELLDALQQRGLTPLIRSSRRHCFEQMAVSSEIVAKIESAMTTWMESNSEVFIRGDVFCFRDYVLFLTFNASGSEDNPQLRAGIVYEGETLEPFRKLDSFSHEIREALVSVFGEFSDNGPNIPEWEQGQPMVPEGFKRFIARQEVDSLYTSLRKETMSRRILAASNLEHQSAREFLRSAREAHMEGYAARLLPGETESREFSIEGLENVGLVEREVQVSCRKTGHALFRLPNAQALAVVTVSDATCSECGSRVSDEKVEEVIAPTQLASSLLEDGSWLVNRLHFSLRQLGVPESEIAVGPSEGTGYGQMMANICGESFLLVTRDGDLTPAFARWAIDLELETEASHLVVVATGRLFNEAALLLQNHSRRRVSGGHDFALVIADDIGTAAKELAVAVESVSQRVVAEHLCYLDNSIGLNVSRLLLTKFNLTTPTLEQPEPLPIPKVPLALAASAFGHTSDIPASG
ncbi:MAG TPA: hypothetical protein VF251_06175, partial [Pyrinomonadaceae bacterium]